MNDIHVWEDQDGNLYCDEFMRRVLDRADTDPRSIQLHLAFEAADDPDAQELLLEELGLRLRELGMMEASQ
ncbi:hypothetical protein [Acidithiobacillus albertensis]|uniref:hypothetical protein n=1 Tax=Acidithiobacillus albertensis TaxID=119978 RepID=UPI001C06B011|nr:hypothetical protein [Acidithiobacillus albertensis]MBU2741284.1 hypothetical protein [Acidithiobacillus albertensis]